MRKSLCLVALAALALTSVATADGDIFWDNNIIEDGFNGRALSPPVFPDIRVADDFNVDGSTSLNGASFAIIEDAGWVPGDVLEVTIYADTGGAGPGAPVYQSVGAFDRMATGRQVFGRDGFVYSAKFDAVTLDAGTYWIGARNPNAGGAGTNYWLTSDGGPDGAGTDTGWFSLDAGNVWTPAGAGWQQAFTLQTPAPGALALLGMAGFIGRRRRRN